MERPYTLPEAARELNYHPHHLGRLLRAGVLEGELVGARWWIPRSEVERIKAMQDKHGRLPLRKRKTHE